MISARHGASVAIERRGKTASRKILALLGAAAFFGSLGSAWVLDQWIFGESRLFAMVRSFPVPQILLLERAVARNPGHSGAWLALARAYSESGLTAEAAEAYENFLALDPRRSEIWTELGIHYLKDGKPEKALEALDRAIALHPQHEDAHLYKGLILLDAFQDLDAAIRAWRQTRRFNATAPDGARSGQDVPPAVVGSLRRIDGSDAAERD